MADNSFNANVGSLFQGMEGFITGKTVVGDAVKFDDGTIILPLVDVSFGVAAGAFAEPGKKENSAGGGRKDPAECDLSDPQWRDEACQCKKSG